MRREFAAFLYDLSSAAQTILDFTHELNLQQFTDDLKTQAAVERKLAVTGEAFVQVRRHFPEQAASPGEVCGAIALRSVLIHEYSRMTPEEIWRTVKTDVPALLNRLKPLIDEDKWQHE